MIQNDAYLFERDPGKPLDKLRRGSSIFEILKQGGHGHPRAAEYPSSTDTFWIPLDYTTRGPIDHAQIVPLRWENVVNGRSEC